VLVRAADGERSLQVDAAEVGAERGAHARDELGEDEVQIGVRRRADRHSVDEVEQ
jgi:hypothetical protein